MNVFLLSFLNQIASELVEFSTRNNISERGKEGESYIINYWKQENLTQRSFCSCGALEHQTLDFSKQSFHIQNLQLW